MRMKTYEIIANKKDLTEDYWLKLRKDRIGGSDAAAACGLDKYKSMTRLYLEKTSDELIKYDNERLRQGRDFEEYVAERFCEETKKKVRRNNNMMVSKKYPFMLADIDREVVGENAFLECKTASPYTLKMREDEGIPLKYQLQCYHYMAVTGFKKCYLAVLVFGEKFFYYELERDEETIEMLINLESQFYNEYIKKGVVPPPDGSTDYDKIINEKFKGSLDETVVLDTKKDTVEEYFSRKDLIKQLEEENKKIEQEIKLQLKENVKGENEYVKVSFKPVVTTRFDSKRFKEENKETYDKYTKETTSRRFTISRI